MNSKKPFEEFYNYKYWRDIQRNQLTISSNIIFTFCVAAVGFTINYLLNENKNLCPIINYFFYLSILMYFISVFFYLLMNISKLIDYQKTVKLILKEVSFDKISEKTKILGKITWIFFILETTFAFLGFLFSIIIFKIIIF